MSNQLEEFTHEEVGMLAYSHEQVKERLNRLERLLEGYEVLHRDVSCPDPPSKNTTRFYIHFVTDKKRQDRQWAELLTDYLGLDGAYILTNPFAVGGDTQVAAILLNPTATHVSTQATRLRKFLTNAGGRWRYVHLQAVDAEADATLFQLFQAVALRLRKNVSYRCRAYAAEEDNKSEEEVQEQDMWSVHVEGTEAATEDAASEFILRHMKGGHEVKYHGMQSIVLDAAFTVMRDGGWDGSIMGVSLF